MGIDNHWQSIWQETKNERQKITKSRKAAKIQAILHQVNGPVRGALNKSTFQNRIPMGHPPGKAGPAAQLNSRGRHLHTQNPHQYTNYQKISTVEQAQIPSREKPNAVEPQPTHPVVPQQKTTWVHTTMGWKKNPFL